MGFFYKHLLHPMISRVTGQYVTHQYVTHLSPGITIEDEILGEAPQSLIDLGMVYTPENKKRDLNNFLSISTPAVVGLNINESD